jgi:hypothetical protein
LSTCFACQPVLLVGGLAAEQHSFLDTRVCSLVINCICKYFAALAVRCCLLAVTCIVSCLQDVRDVVRSYDGEEDVAAAFKRRMAQLAQQKKSSSGGRFRRS